jgi:hypothetical protein
MITTKASIARRRPPGVLRKGLGEFLPTSVQKSYFMLSDAEREVLDSALAQYRPGQLDPILVGSGEMLKPALGLMTSYRLVIEEIRGPAVIAHYTRWVDSVQLMDGDNQEVYVAFSPRFEHIWLESKKCLPDCMGQKPANTGLRSQYALRMYSWAKKYVTVGKKRVSLEELRKVLGLESVKDANGNVVQESALPVWANFRQRALDTAIAQINQKTDLTVALESLERSKYRRVTALTFLIKVHI